MLFSYLTLFLLGLFFLSTAVESTTDKTLELKFPNRHFHASSSAMCAMLKRADLENNGYKKKIITNVVEEPGSNKTNSQTVYYYEKSVECSYKAIEDNGQQLNTSLPGVFGKEMRMEMRKEKYLRNLKGAKECKMGLEIDFKYGLGCDLQRGTKRRLDDTYIIVIKSGDTYIVLVIDVK